MEILDKSKACKQIVNTIITKARYQKVIICLDEDSDVEFIDSVVDAINSNTVVVKYFYNKHTIKDFYKMVNNGARIVIYNIKTSLFYKLQTDNVYVLNIFIPQSKFLLPYLSNVESLYGDNIIVTNMQDKDYLSLIFLYQLALDNVWTNIIQNQKVDVNIFKNIDAMANGCVDFGLELTAQSFLVRSNLDDGYKVVEEKQLPYYIYLKLCFILKMCEMVDSQDLECVDFYKTEKSLKGIDKAYNLIFKYQILDVLKLHSENLIKVSSIVLNRIKIIIKKYFNFKNIQLNKLIKLIKNQSRDLNLDNLLYISHVFNVIK